MMDFVPKMMDFVPKMMDFVLKMMDFVPKMIAYVLKMMDFALTKGDVLDIKMGNVDGIITVLTVGPNASRNYPLLQEGMALLKASGLPDFDGGRKIDLSYEWTGKRLGDFIAACMEFLQTGNGTSGGGSSSLGAKAPAPSLTFGFHTKTWEFKLTGGSDEDMRMLEEWGNCIVTRMPKDEFWCDLRAIFACFSSDFRLIWACFC